MLDSHNKHFTEYKHIPYKRERRKEEKKNLILSTQYFVGGTTRYEKRSVKTLES